MSDWKARVDAWEELKQRKRKTAQQGRTLTAQSQQNIKPTAKHHPRWSQVPTLAVHQRRFRCHVCRTPSRGPHISTTVEFGWVSSWKDTDEPYYEGIEYVQHVNWDQPTGLWRCVRCHAWTCGDHLYKTICQRCADKLEA
jgi:hypothetical protein